MRNIHWTSLFLIFIVAEGLISSNVAIAADLKSDTLIKIRGAGATFPAPLYNKWIKEYKRTHPAIEISYDAVGSGEGIKRFIAGEVDFGASDAAMNDAQMTQVNRGVQLIPATAGIIVLAYNLPGIEGTLKLPRDVYVDIFSAKIKKWNDPRITTANPLLNLPNTNIAIVTRVESSGTTYAFTNHLSVISDEWRDRGPGVGKAIDWPGNSMSARGNEGVAARIKLSEGSIGYVEYGYAKRARLSMAWLQNHAGQMIAPSLESGRMTLVNTEKDMPENLRMFMPDPQGVDSYPIVTYSWLILHKQYPDNGNKRNQLKEFVNWGLTTGQDYSNELGYIKLSSSIIQRSTHSVDLIQ